MLPGPLPELTPAALERFWSKVKKSDACWLWTGTLAKGGYGAFKTQGRMYTATRIMYVLSGRQLPQGYLVRHTCDNPPCVNPKHLVRGTTRQNSDDMHKRGRANTPVGKRTRCAKLSSLEVLAVRSMRLAGYTQQSIADRFSIRRESVRDILTGRSYSWLDANGYNKRTGELAL